MTAVDVAPPQASPARSREFLKFALVGGLTFLVDNGVWYALKLSVLEHRPTTAKAIGILVAVVVSYVLNREWSFSTRAGRDRFPEMALFFAVSGAALVVNLIPLYFSRYVLDLEEPHVSLLTQESADFVSGSVIGVGLAMVVRFWGLRRFVFPVQLDAPRREQVRTVEVIREP